MSKLELFGLQPSSYVRTAMMAFAAKGVAFDLTPVDFRAAEYKQHHPFRRMPAMRHGDVALYEALAIAVYVDSAFDGPALQPASSAERAQMFQWISVINDYVYGSLVGGCIAERFLKPMRGQTPDEEVIRIARPKIAEHLDILNTALTRQSYLAGDQFSLAECFLAPILFYFAHTPEGHEMLPDYPALQAWQTRVAQMPGYDQINRLAS